MAASALPPCPTRTPGNIKFGTEELMELVDLFTISASGKQAILDVLAREETPPNAGLMFRYYNAKAKTPQFEKLFAEKIGTTYALGVNSCTSALIAACVAAGVGPGDEVIVPAHTFFASASAIVVAKGIPVIVDIDETLGLDPAAVRRAITPRTKAMIVVHMGGYPARMDRLMAIAREHKLKVIEDVAQACGGSFKGKKLGSFGDLGCFSLDSYKVIATGEGGVVTTDDEWLYTRAQSYHDTAACWRPDRYYRERREGELFCGENYRMSEMAAAVGLAQLRKLDWITQSTKFSWDFMRAEVKLPSFVRWMAPSDPDGVCGYRSYMIFEKAELLLKACQGKIGISGHAGGGAEGARDWHIYNFWEHILEQKTATAEGCPFRCPHVQKLPAYSPDMCPQTLDIVARMGFIGTGPGATEAGLAERAKKLGDSLAALA